MKHNTLLHWTKKMAALSAAAVLTAVTAFSGSVSAAGTYTMASSGNATFTLNKYLVMDSSANVPASTFTFTIAAGTAQASSAVPVYAGVDVSNVKWNGIAGDSGTISIAAGATTTAVNGSTDPSDILAGSFTTSDKYATGTTTLDFSACNFTKPGVYRYALTETAGSADGMTYDTTTRYLDVYVDDATTGSDLELKVSDFRLHTTQNATIGSDGNYTTVAKSEGFVNSYEAEALTINSAVAGNQGDKTKEFTYTLKITDVAAGSTFTMPSGVSNLALTSSGLGTLSGNVLTANAAGMVEVSFTMVHGDCVEIPGLPVGAKYTVSVDADGYTASYTTTAITSETTGNTVTETVASATVPAVNFTLTKTGVVPTGVILTIAPFAGITLLGAAGIATVTRRKKKEDEEV